MMYPAKVGGLILVNLSPTAVSWADPEWLIQKVHPWLISGQSFHNENRSLLNIFVKTS